MQENNILEKLNLKQINHRIFKMILPMTIDNTLQMIAGLISMGMVGRISVLAVSAIGIGTRITQIIWALFKGVTTGATVFIAQYYGAGDYKKLKNVARQTLLSGILLVIILMLIVHSGAGYILQVFNPDKELLYNATQYLKIVSFGLPFLAIMLIVGGILQGMGNATTPMIITIIMNIVNIVISYILIFGKLGFPSMGIAGAALATVISQIVAAVIGLYVLFNRNGILHSYFNRQMFDFDSKQTAAIYRIGLPSSCESIFWQIASIVLMRAILTYGETAFAAHQLGMQAESISYTPAMGFGVAATAFIGQALGARDKKLAKIYLKQIIKGALIITSLAVIMLLCFPKLLMSGLTNNKDVIRLGSIYLMLMGLVEIPQNIAGVLGGAMRGAGYTKVPMLIAGIGLWGIRVPLTLIVAYCLKYSIVAIWTVMCIDLFCRFLISILLYKKKNIYESSLI